MSLAFDCPSTRRSLEPAEIRRALAGISGFKTEERLPAVPTGFACLDSVLPGNGLPVGCLTEVRGTATSGKLSLVLGMIRAALRRGEPAALIDASRSIVPPVAAEPLYEDLLVARAAASEDAIQALDVLLRTGIFPLVALDLTPLVRPLPNAVLTRLVREARVSGTALIVVSQGSATSPLAPAFAGLRLEVRREGPSALRVLVAKSKQGGDGATALISFADDTENPRPEAPAHLGVFRQAQHLSLGASRANDKHFGLGAAHASATLRP